MKNHKSIDNDTIIVQAEGIDATDLNGEKVMMNLDKGQYFALNQVGSRIWDIINKPASVKEITDTLIKEYDIDEETCKSSVITFLEGMNDVEIIKTT
jgi:hydroxymethylpyrimidine pyrophosphatase-like HAD family hydrolase